MRFLWIREQDEPNYQKAQTNGITGFYFDPRDPRITRDYLKNVQAKGYAVGIYAGAAWGELGDTPDEYVDVMEGWVAALQQGYKDNNFPRVQWDLEMHDPNFIKEVLRLWRNARPNHSTSWTMEPMQGGWMSPEFVQFVLGYKIRIVPQYYGGQMEPFAQDRTLLDLTTRGFPTSIISGMYDAKALPAWWDGFAFIQDRLP